MAAYQILPNIDTPEKLKKLTTEQLLLLSAELRQRIIEVLSINGGHLGSNLGCVELTVALHRVFDSPKDKFLWDVSHQTYSHKILTGRNDRFETIRQFKGLCGFSHPKESPHDHFHAGHAGTALSLALGTATTRDLLNSDEYIIPIIGDATLTCGMSLEALNNIPENLKKFIIILNDNEMSISKNVGAITQILSRILSNPTTHKLHQELDNLLAKIPSYGSTLSKQGHKITESLKNLVSPAAFFEQYGVSYIGPIDGHDVKKLIDVLEGVKQSQCPVLIHVLTKKGQGMEEAMNNPVPYHGAKPFDKETGLFLTTKAALPTFPKIFGNHLLSMAEKDGAIVAVTPAMIAGSCLEGFIKKYPQRCLDVGIAESHAVTFSGGLAYGGNVKVVASIYSSFLQRALDNLFHDVCLQHLPVIFAIDRAGISGPDGSTHHGIYDISFLNAMPNMVISQPRNGRVLKELLNSAFSWGRPAAIRYPNLSTEDEEAIVNRELGKGEVLIKGKDILIVALGHMNTPAAKVCDMLREIGIKATLLDPIFVKPLDEELFAELLETHNKVVTIEEHAVNCGLGSIVNNYLMTNGYSTTQVLNIGIPQAFIEHGSHGELSEEIGLSPTKIYASILKHFSFEGCLKSQDLITQ